MTKSCPAKEFWFFSGEVMQDHRFKFMWDSESVWMPLSFIGHEGFEREVADVLKSEVITREDVAYTRHDHVVKRLINQGKMDVAERLGDIIDRVKRRYQGVSSIVNRIDEDGMAYFDCFWCREEKGQFTSLHHTTEVKATGQLRPCCNDCYSDKFSHYRKVYGTSMTPKLESEVANGKSD